jgi:molybdopterin molybdotransferase
MNGPKPASLRELSCADDYDPNSMSVEKARETIHQFLSPVAATERVAIRAALGRVLAQDVISPIDVPGHRNSAMDGYAVRHAELKGDASVSLKVVGTAFAGKPYLGAMGAGECVRIMTGAVMPPEADTSVMQEMVTREGNVVTIPPLPDTKIKFKGQNTRDRGEDIKAGALVFAKGRLIRAAELGLLASLGINELTVYRKLRVAFFSTGDELKSIGQPLDFGDIYDSNRYTLYGMLQRLGCEVMDMGVVIDEPAALEAAFIAASGAADVVMTSGGVSVGEADYIKAMLDKLGEVLFWKIAMKPGRPLAYGKIGGAHFFGLPGNPVSVMVTFYQFVQSALKVLQGRTDVQAVPRFKAALTTPIKKAPGRTEFQRAVVTPTADGTLQVAVTGDQGSGILTSMAAANCFVVLGTDVGNCDAGTLVDVELFEGIL